MRHWHPALALALAEPVELLLVELLELLLKLLEQRGITEVDQVWIVGVVGVVVGVSVGVL